MVTLADSAAPELGRTAVDLARAGSRFRWIVACLTLVALIAAASVLALSVGSLAIPPADVVAALIGRGTDEARIVVIELRLPRVAAGVLVGAAFGASGALLQALAGNPLASPDVIGITAGASAAAVAVIVVGSGAILSPAALPLAALVGGLLTAGLVLGLTRSGMDPYRLVLTGIAVAAMLQAVTSYLLAKAEITEAQRAAVWLTGSLNGRDWSQTRALLLALAVLLPAAVLLIPRLRALQLGPSVAAGLGVPVGPARITVVAVCVGLAAVATATAGPVTFVAFVCAPIARRLVGSPVALVPATLVGALLVVAADLVARTALSPIEFPVGVVTAVVGAPYLLWLLARAQAAGRTD